MSALNVFGIGNPLIDLLANVPSAFLKKVDLEKDRMYLVDLDSQRQLILQLVDQQIPMHYASGGSCANTMIGIAQLGGIAAFTGKIGDDDHGQVYQKKLSEFGVQTHLGIQSGMTGSSLVLVTEDGARTMNTCLGMCQNLHSSDIPLEILSQAQYFYYTGYLWDTESQKDAVLVALKTAQSAGVSVAMSLSDPFCVNRHQDDFKKLLTEYVDLVFCNQEEAFAIANTNMTQEALNFLSSLVDTVVLTLGSRGALICRGKETVYVDPVPTSVVDTTGAGDAFAAGILYGLTHQQSLLRSGQIAAHFASRVIGQLGPRLDNHGMHELKKIIF